MKNQAQPSMGTAAALYIVAVLGCGAVALLWSWTVPVPLGIGPVSLLFWFLLCIAAEAFWLPSLGGGGMVSMALAADLALLFLLPAPWAVGIATASVLVSDFAFHRRDAVRAMFNAGQTAISMGAARMAMDLLGASRVPAGTETVLLHPLASVAVLPAFVLVNSILVSGIISLTTGGSFYTTWRRNFGNAAHTLSCVALFVVAIGITGGVETFGTIAALVSLLILLVLRDAYRALVRRAHLSPRV